MRRIIRSEEEKAAPIARFEQGGTTAREFCREQGVACHSFLAWLRKAGGHQARRRAAPPPGFIEVFRFQNPISQLALRWPTQPG